MRGKHSEKRLKIKQLEETIRLKDREIRDIKSSVISVLRDIMIFNEGNVYDNPSVKKRKISEMCTDAIYELWVDELDRDYEEKNIEPNTTRQDHIIVL